MRHQEQYWSRKRPPTPDAHELPSGIFAGDQFEWEKLSPGFRRSIWREAVVREARERSLTHETIERLKIATIEGWLATLDQYLDAFQIEDERRAPIQEDVERIKRADQKHQQSEVQIKSREAA